MADDNGQGAPAEVAVPLAVKTSDLPVRVASALAMLVIAGAALWAGGRWLDLFIAVVVLVAFGEFLRLVLKAVAAPAARVFGGLAGALYMGLAGLLLTRLPTGMIVAIIGAVIFVDTFAYFIGRAIGGPKIAPRISPSKTWAGLLGGIAGASLWVAFWVYIVAKALNGVSPWTFGGHDALVILAGGTAIAVCAQAGDFFESWLKRRAGVKDSSNLLPGHGGVFDRIDGMIPVVLLAGLVFGWPA